MKILTLRTGLTPGSRKVFREKRWLGRLFADLNWLSWASQDEVPE